MMPDTVYVVTSGDYSSYRINGVYLDEAEAKKHARLKDHQVEAWPLEATAPAMVEVLTCRLTLVGGTVEPLAVTYSRQNVEQLTSEYQALKSQGITGRQKELLGAELRRARFAHRELINDPATRDLPRPSPIYKRGWSVEWVEASDTYSNHELVVHGQSAYREEPIVSGTDFERVRKVFSEQCAQFFYAHPDYREVDE